MSGTIRFESVSVGDALPPLVKPPISRLQLALFAGTSGDHNPIHVDDEAAKVGGLPGVIAHGMLNMAFLGQLLTGWVPPNRLRAFSNRFAAMAYPGDVITLTGTVTAKKEEAGEKRVELEIFASNQKGDKLLVGAATVALD
ncbi:MAG: MaoC family dehydratase [Rhodospirillales bacterium]|nr:MaoC family dehydratase [Rhodospirillales bacterium]